MHDVIIVGAGPAGSSTAYFLSRAGLDVLLLDKSVFPRDKTCGDGLTPRALAVLDEMGLLGELDWHGFRMNEATVFAPNGDRITTRVPNGNGVPSYMLSIPRLTLDELILRKAIEAGARLEEGVRVTGIDWAEGQVRVKAKGGLDVHSAEARLIVIAVGASQRLLYQLGILKDAPNMILAARAYYDGLRPLSSQFEFHFDGVPLPGYGWVFPLSTSSANVGAGVLRAKQSRKQKPPSAKSILQQFLQLPRMRAMMSAARQVGPVKGFPLRTDFATAKTHANRLLLVGEAAGLVNPLTGEGVDYALESGKIAADFLVERLAGGDLSAESLSGYDRLLRERFQRIFVFSGRIRDWYLNAPVLNRLVRAANRRDRLRELFTDIVLGNTDAAEAMTLRTMIQILVAR